jgi:glycosyltransferase involved in cell wall biosynthesis
MSCYNSEKHLREAVESVLNSTYENLDFIIWNDGSSDSTERIIKSYNDKRIRYFYHENTGLGKALNMACKEAKGKYIARMDSDDICEPERFSIEVEYLEKHPDVVLVSCFASTINEEGVFQGYGITYSNQKLVKSNPASIYHPGVMLRAEVYNQTLGYPPLKTAEDLFLWHSLLRLGDIKIIERPLIKYRISEGSLSSNWNDYMINNMNTLWRIIANKSNLKEEDYNYLNAFIKDNINKGEDRKRESRQLETVIINALSKIIPMNWAFYIVARIKNCYGRVVYYKNID